MIIVVIGVSGSGKSTLGAALAEALGWQFVEGDDFHPPENIARMSRGEALDDADRWPWLAAIHRRLLALQQNGQDAVLACSALKKSYRAALGEDLPDIRFVYLCGDPELIRQRLLSRSEHFMPASLLDSQVAALEPPRDATLVPLELPTDAQVSEVLRALQAEEIRVSTPRTEVMVAGLAFPEAPRWHGGRLWFTDQHAHTVNTVDGDGRLHVEARCDDLPGGLGWLPDGSLLVVFMTRRCIMRLADGEFSLYADLSGHAGFHCNDIVVDHAGRVYAGNFGFDLHGGEATTAAEILLIDRDGSIETFAEEVVFPNGSVITPDDESLLVAETFAHRISAFRLDAHGRMRTRRVWAELGAMTPDGICLDAEGALWVASPGTRELARVAAGGAVLARVCTTGTPYACMLGGERRRTLFVCTSETDDPQRAAQLKTGRIERIDVQVPGAGLP